MNIRKFAPVICVSAFSLSAQADVKSLTSNELTETYIKDSTIIVTPKKSEQVAKPKQATTLTISPGESPVSEEEKQYEFEKMTVEREDQISGAVANADDQLRDFELTKDVAALVPLQPKVPEATFEPVRNLPPGLEIPIGDFDYNFIGNELGLSRSGDQLTFSFGNLPGVDTIDIPQSIQGQGLQLVPRATGGFDLIVDIPKD